MQDSEYYRKDLAFIISEEIAKTMSTLTSEIQPIKSERMSKPTKRPIFSLNTIKTSCMFAEAKIYGALISFLVDICSAVSILEEDFLTCFIER